jgi:AcrR family transcriptional regulator
MSMDKSPADRRSAILEAASKVFQAKGFQRATTLDIASAAGVSKRDLYALFASKDALLEAMIRRGVDAMVPPAALRPAASRDEVYRALAAFGAALLDLLLSPSVLGLYRLAIAEAPTSAAVGEALLQAGARRSTERVAEFLAAAEADGHVAYVRRDAAVGAYFFALFGDLQMRALLAPSRLIEPAERQRHAALAVLVLQRMEVAAPPR